MNDIVQDHDNSADLAAVELEAMKAKADQLGVKYHPSISAEKLSAKIKAHLENDVPQEDAPVEKRETPGQIAKRVQLEALKLIRVNITCMNPAKAEWDGEIFTVGNEVIPTQRKFVKFNTPEGYHVPQIMLDVIKERQFQTYYTERAANGIDVRRSKQTPEFAVQILPQLTEKELADLARVQATAGLIE